MYDSKKIRSAHKDAADRYGKRQPRPVPRRQKTKRAAVLAAVKEA